MLLRYTGINDVYAAEKEDCAMIDIFLLEQLDAFARTGTLSRAAEELHITQPALSRNMKKLEATLGVSLFNR